MAAAVVRTLGSGLGKNLREVRLHLCQTSAASKGASLQKTLQLCVLCLILVVSAAGLRYWFWEKFFSPVGDFVEQHYVPLKKANPDFPFLIRECSGVSAQLWARYDLGKEQSVSVDNMSAEQVAGALKTLVQSKP